MSDNEPRRRLVCYAHAVGWIPVEVTPHTQPIIDLLTNGANLALTLTKEDGLEFRYMLVTDAEEAILQ